MKRALLYIFFFLSIAVTKAQYISEVLEYHPAPGQFINAEPWGTPSSVNTVVGNVNGTLSLGAFGGYVVFRFEKAVVDDPENPFGVDFTIFGNAMNNLSEAGIVYVMRDDNQNGVPDDTWYQLAGSDYFFSTSIKGYSVRYTNPNQEMATDVPWSDNMGNKGFIYANEIHTQAYYPLQDSFPNVNPYVDSLNGFSIIQVVDSITGIVQFPQRAFGYADNHPRGEGSISLPDNPYTYELENGGGDAFDLQWAVDEEGNHVILDSIHFIKVQTASLQNGGWLGEISTEIAGAYDIAPDPTVTGVREMIVIRDLPVVLDTNALKLEVFVFHQGQLQQGKEVSFDLSLEGAWIDNDYVLHVSESGDLEITASLAENPEITAHVITRVDLQQGIENHLVKEKRLVYPNPAKQFIQIKTEGSSRLFIFDEVGEIIRDISNYEEKQKINISALPPGLYFVGIVKDHSYQTARFIKM